MSSRQTLVESQGSSSPIITRAVAAGLSGKYCDTYSFPTWQTYALHGLGYLPQRAARYIIPRVNSLSGLDPDLLSGLSIDSLAQLRLKDYGIINRRFPCVTIGAGLGGASAHLALALDGPFLPQAYVITLRGGAPDGDVTTYFQRSAQLAGDIARQNPGIITIQHYDPIHDEWLTRHVYFLRFKILDLPSCYKEFLKRSLQPGGSICYLDCRARWLRYRIGERSYFQVGGWGDISAQEFLSGSPRIENYCQKVKMRRHNWQLTGYPLEEGLESEWGCEPGLGEALAEFSAQEGYQFIPISLPEPHDFSRLAYQATLHMLEKDGLPPAGVIVEMFTQFDATAVIKGGLLPLWLIFNTMDSLAFLKSMRSEFPEDKPVFFSPLSTFTPTPDLVPWQEWDQALRGSNWHNIGTRPSHYPADAKALVDWVKPLREWVAQHPQPIRSRLKPEELKQIAEQFWPS